MSYDELTITERPQVNSRDIRARVLQARALQAERFKDLSEVYCNAQMPSRMVHEVCQLQPQHRHDAKLCRSTSGRVKR